MPNPTSYKERTFRGSNIWVVRHLDGFSIKVERNGQLLIPPSSQQLAITIARQLARANRSELIVQSEIGRIRLRDSHGSDPFPPKG